MRLHSRLLSYTFLTTLTTTLLHPAVASAQAAYPMLMSVEPVAAQIGQTSEHTLHSRYSMDGAYQVLVSGDGVTGQVPPVEEKEGEKPNAQKLNLRFQVSGDARPGVRDFRIATPQGASTLGQLVITPHPVVRELRDNNDREHAQAVELPAAICGAIDPAEDVDVFKFRAAAGQAISFHVRSLRLQNRIHDLQQHIDPILELKTGNGTTLAASDNFFSGDPFLHHRFEQDGEYFLQIRDVRFQGNRYWQYCIEVSDQPFITNVHPLGVAQGQTARLELVAYPPLDQATFVSLPPAELVGGRRLTLPVSGSPVNPAPVVVSDLPVIVENPEENGEAASAQPIALPVGISGRIAPASDIDCYKFAAMKGERYEFEVQARRHQSQLDSHLRLLDANGKQLALNDDLRLGQRSHADSWIENWTAPADGDYVLEIRDLHLRGGADFVYFIRATRSAPRFELYLDTDKTLLSPGLSGVMFVRAIRKNGFDGDIQLDIDGLPDGVTASCGRILAGKGEDGCIVLTAAADATLAASNVVVRGVAEHATPDGGTVTLTSIATPNQETYQPGGGRGHWPVEMHTVAVGTPGDIVAVELSRHEITLKPGESQRIDVKLKRAEDFDKNVTLDVTYNHLNRVYGSSLPPGVTVDKKNSKTLLTGTTAEGHITLTAAKDAPAVQRQQLAIMANVSLNFVMKATYASNPVWVTVEQ